MHSTRARNQAVRSLLNLASVARSAATPASIHTPKVWTSWRSLARPSFSPFHYRSFTSTPSQWANEALQKELLDGVTFGTRVGERIQLKNATRQIELPRGILGKQTYLLFLPRSDLFFGYHRKLSYQNPQVWRTFHRQCRSESCLDRLGSKDQVSPPPPPTISEGSGSKTRVLFLVFDFFFTDSQKVFLLPL